MTITDSAVGAGFVERRVTAAGFDLPYWEAGSGTPVVFLPGAGGARLTRAHDLLAQRYRVIVLQMPGWGDATNDCADFDELADQVVAVVDALGLDTFHLVGTSLGGACALHVAMRHGNRLISLTLEGPGEIRANSVHPATLSPEAFAAAFRRHPEREPGLEPPDPEFMGRVWPMIDRLMGTGEADPVLLERMTGVDVRTLVLFGRHDGIIHPSNGPTYKRHLPNASLVYVYDAAHDIQCDRPEAFADIVGDFIQRGMNFMVNNADRLINP